NIIVSVDNKRPSVVASYNRRQERFFLNRIKPHRNGFRHIHDQIHFVFFQLCVC
ncbi:hypothetical protein ACI65C_006947, partial [Semiaphis heraclei]